MFHFVRYIQTHCPPEGCLLWPWNVFALLLVCLGIYLKWGDYRWRLALAEEKRQYDAYVAAVRPSPAVSDRDPAYWCNSGIMVPELRTITIEK